MNVVHLSTSLRDGAGIAASRQISAIRASGIDCAVLTADDEARTLRPRPLPARLFRRVFTSRLERLRRRLVALGPGDYELFSFPFSSHAPETHPAVRRADLVHLHWTAGFIDYPRFFARLRQPLVWTLHDQHPALGGFHYELDRDANPALRTLDEECLAIKRRALAPHRLAIIGNSEWTTARARASSLFPPDTLFETIYYPLDTEAYAPRDPASTRSALGLPSDRLVVGFASTALDNRRKGLADLLEALSSLPSATPPISLLSFGRNPSDEVRAAVSIPWIHLGFLYEDRVKAAAYSAMDCFVVPSRAEAFGQTAIEALSCGVPVLASAVGGLSEAIDHGRVGVAFPPARPDLLREALLSLLRDPSRRQTLSALGRTHAIERHDPARHAAACSRVYETISTR